MTTDTRVAEAVVVRGHSGYLIVPIVLVPALTAAAFTYFRDRLPEFCVENAAAVFAIVGALTLALAGVALFQRARRVELRAGRLSYHSWLGDRTIATDAITAATLETEVSGGAEHTLTESYLTLWSGGEIVARFSPQRWPEAGLRSLVVALQRARPSMQIDRAVLRSIES